MTSKGLLHIRTSVVYEHVKIVTSAAGGALSHRQLGVEISERIVDEKIKLLVSSKKSVGFRRGL